MLDVSDSDRARHCGVPRRELTSRSTQPIARHVWETRYRACAAEVSVQATWRRVAHALAEAEPQPDEWEQRFLDILQDFQFLPGGRILAGAGRTAT